MRHQHFTISPLPWAHRSHRTLQMEAMLRGASRFGWWVSWGTMSVYQSWQTISGFQFLLVLLGQHSLKSHLRQDTCSCFCSFPFYLFHLFPCPWKGSRPHTCPVSCPRRRYISSVCAGVSRQFHCGIVSCLPLQKAQGFWVSQARQLDLRCFVFVFCKSNTLQISFVRIYIHVSSSIHIHAHMFPAMYVPRLCAHALKKKRIMYPSDHLLNQRQNNLFTLSCTTSRK